jgi:colanic acid/amylovoran biosynthesis protein
MSKKILLVNVHSNANIGDSALTKIAIELLKTNFPGATVTLSMDDPESWDGDEPVIPSFLTWIKFTQDPNRSHWRLNGIVALIIYSLIIGISYRYFKKSLYSFIPKDRRSLLKAYADADLVVSTAGGFLYSSGKAGITFFYNFFILALAILLGKPLYLLPQSIGPLYRERDKRMVQWLLSRARLVMLREKISLELVKSLKLDHSRYFLIPDIAFGLQGASHLKAREWLSKKGIHVCSDKPRLGITVINWGAENFRFQRQSEYEQAIFETAQWFMQKYDGEVFFYTQVFGPSPSQYDQIVTKRLGEKLAEELNANENVHIIIEKIPPHLLQALYGELDIFIGTRMHSNIFALNQGTPVIAIGYQYKTIGITEMADLGKWTIDIEEVTGPILIDKLNELWLTRQEVRKKIEVKVAVLANEINRAGLLICNDFSTTQKE